MKHLLIFSIILFSCAGFAQDTSIDKGSGYLYFSDVPGTTPNTSCCAELAFNTADQSFWHWNRDSSAWKRTVNITQQGGAPSSDPGTSPKLYLDTDTYKLYWWNGSGWDDLTIGGGGGGGGDVTSVFGRTGAVAAASGDYNAGQVTNTPAGDITSTTAQGAINELEGLRMDTLFAHNDSTIRIIRGDLTQWDVEILGADNLGNHTATQNINIGTNHLSPDGGGYGLKLTAAGDLIVENSGFVGTELRITEASASGDDAIILKAPDNMSGDINFNFPNSEGTADQVLRTDGSGNLSWVNQTGGGGADSTIFSTNYRRDTAIANIRTELDSLSSTAYGNVGVFENYSNLRANTDTIEVALIKDEQRQGTFLKCSACTTDDGGSVIKDANDFYYKRIIETEDTYLKWFEQVNHTARFNAAAGVGLKNIHLEIDTAYIIQQTTNTNFQNKTIVGAAGSTIGTGQHYFTEIQNTTSAGTTFLLVPDATDFENREVSIGGSSADADIRAYQTGHFTSPVSSIGINGGGNDTIFLSRAVNQNVLGDTVFTVPKPFYVQNASIEFKDVAIVESLENNLFSASWRTSVFCDGNSDIRVTNSSAEDAAYTLFIGHTMIAKGFEADSIATFYHQSQSSGVSYVNMSKTVLEDVTIKNSGINRADCGHCEGSLFTFSNGGYNIIIRDAKVLNSGTAIGQATEDDYNVELYNTIIASQTQDEPAIRLSTGFTASNSTDERLIIDNVDLINQGLEITGGGGPGVGYKIKSNGLNILNGILHLQGVRGIMANTVIELDSSYNNTIGVYSLTENLDNAAMVVRNCYFLTFNTLKVNSREYDPIIYTGIAYENSAVITVNDFEVFGFTQAVNTFHEGNVAVRRSARRYRFNNGVVEVSGQGNATSGKYPFCFKMNRGTELLNVYMELDTVGAGPNTGRPIIPSMDDESNSDDEGVTIMYCRIKTNASIGLAYNAGIGEDTQDYSRTDHSLIEYNFCWSNGGSSSVSGDTGFAAGEWVDMNTTNADRAYTSFRGNRCFNDADTEISIESPIYLDVENPFLN